MSTGQHLHYLGHSEVTLYVITIQHAIRHSHTPTAMVSLTAVLLRVHRSKDHIPVEIHVSTDWVNSRKSRCVILLQRVCNTAARLARARRAGDENELVLRRQMLLRLFNISAGIVFGITGAAKCFSAFGNAKLLAVPAPVLGIQFRELLIGVGILEIATSMICLRTNKGNMAIMLVAWLSTNIVAYRLCLWWTGWRRPCACLGNLSDGLGISPHTADTLMKWALAYLVVGSYAMLFYLWRIKNGSQKSGIGTIDGIGNVN